MKAITILGVGLLLPHLVFASGASAPITLTETIQPVTVGGKAVTEGTVLTGGGTVRTATDGRAELAFGTSAVLRLGADTEVELNLLGDTATLRRGSAVASGFTGDRRLVVEHVGRSVVIGGGASFVELAENADGQGRVLVVGAMAGRVQARGLGVPATLRPGDLCALDGQGAITLGQFNLTRQVATATLVNGFRLPLLGMENVRRAVKEFAALEARGFVRATDAPGTAVASRKLNRTGAELATLAIPAATQTVQLTQTGSSAGALNLGGLSVMNATSGMNMSSRNVFTGAGTTLALNGGAVAIGDLIVSSSTLTLTGNVVSGGSLPGNYSLISYNGSLGATRTLTLGGNAQVIQMEVVRIVGASGPPLPPTPLQPAQ